MLGGGGQYSLWGISTPTKAAAGPLGFSTDLAGSSCFQRPPTRQLQLRLLTLSLFHYLLYLQGDYLHHR